MAIRKNILICLAFLRVGWGGLHFANSVQVNTTAHLTQSTRDFETGTAAATCSGENGIAAAIPGEFGPQGLDTRTFSKTVLPGGDFFTYADEGWITSTQIPPGYWDYGQTSVLIRKIDEQIKSLITTSLAGPSSRGSAAQQVGDAYTSFLNTDRTDQVGIGRIQTDLKRIFSSKTSVDIARWMANPTSSSIVAINVFPEGGRWLVHLDQSNLNQPMLGLWGRDSYERNDGSYATNRAAYQAYIATILERAGVENASARAARVVALETRIAANQWTLDKIRDRKANYHPMSVQELELYAPGFPWRAFLDARGVANISDVVLGTDTSIKAQAKLFADTPLDDWRSYVAFHWLQNQIDLLPKTFRDASWAFFGQTLSNAKVPPTREYVALHLVSSSLGQQVGQLYVQKYFSAGAKASAEEMLRYLLNAFAERLANVTWMDEATRAEAQADSYLIDNGSGTRSGIATTRSGSDERNCLSGNAPAIPVGTTGTCVQRQVIS